MRAEPRAAATASGCDARNLGRSAEDRGRRGWRRAGPEGAGRRRPTATADASVPPPRGDQMPGRAGSAERTPAGSASGWGTGARAIASASRP